MKKYDVVILGGGMAGLSLARQLRIKDDGLKILILEKSPKVTEWKVGEATVEIASSYFLKELNLTNYLFKKHLHKNGLRYFFDDKDN
jgi:2-polyprenyl-6-methoxyphenol hydroxylase-like FAD-dependent oxidoreductase